MRQKSKGNSKSSESTSNFLIHIVNETTEINGEPHTLTFFKDITFGVLYE